MKKIIKSTLLLGLILGAQPALAHNSLSYSFATHKIYLNIGFPYTSWWSSSILEPRPYQMQMPRPGSYATWQRNRDALTKIALAKMQAYANTKLPSTPQPLEPGAIVSNPKSVPQIQFQTPATNH